MRLRDTEQVSALPRQGHLEIKPFKASSLRGFNRLKTSHPWQYVSLIERGLRPAVDCYRVMRCDTEHRIEIFKISANCEALLFKGEMNSNPKHTFVSNQNNKSFHL